MRNGTGGIIHVFPLVASTIILPFSINPIFSDLSKIHFTGLSLIEPPGLTDSSFSYNFSEASFNVFASIFQWQMGSLKSVWVTDDGSRQKTRVQLVRALNITTDYKDIHSMHSTSIIYYILYIL